ncbi:hypothetical protein PM082_006431 [Marasmius tenuissimus]|nr:hypothetical protein PM082_006431 [Marasmius tenuissimus]
MFHKGQKSFKTSDLNNRRTLFDAPSLIIPPGISPSRTSVIASGQGLVTKQVVDGLGLPKRKPVDQAGSAQSRRAKRRKRFYTSQGQSVMLSRFREPANMKILIEAIMGQEFHPLTGRTCCAEATTRTVCCLDCTVTVPTCTACFLAAHRLLLFHWGEIWNGRYFERKESHELGVVFHLGHNGDRCESVAPDSIPVNVTVVDCNGIHTVKIIYCQCPGHSGRFQQVLKARLFPATVDLPQTLFTFDLLKDFHLHTLSSKKTAYDYLYALRMKTDNAFPQDVKNPMQEFNRHELGRSFPLRKPGATAFPCFACPEPGFNVAEEWAEDEDVDDEFVHLATAFWSLDGHFGLQRRQKIDDPDDISLLEGSAMFPKDDWFNDIMAKHGKRSPEKSNCAKFKVMELQNRLKFKGCVISGVVAVQCARHRVFMAAMDLRLGETQIHGDLAIAIAMQFVMAEALQRTKFFQRLLMIYDIACQFYVKLRQRFKEYLPELSDIVDFMHWLVGKMHLDNHISACKYRFNLNYTKGCGRTDGEAIERTWAEHKQSGGSTKEMNHGGRHDAIIDFWNHWNWTRLVRMIHLLKTKIINGRKRIIERVDYYMRLTVAAGEERVKRWEAMSTKPVYNPVMKEVTSVYWYDETLLPSQELVLNSLLERERKQEEREEEGCNGTEAVAFINQGLKLESLQLEIKRLVKAAELTPEEVVHKRDYLRTRMKPWQELQSDYMPDLRKQETEKEVVFAEDQELYMPSSPLNSHYAQSSLGEIKADLRKGQAYETVSELKYTLSHTAALVRTKVKQARGAIPNTRAKKFIR